MPQPTSAQEGRTGPTQRKGSQPRCHGSSLQHFPSCLRSLWGLRPPPLLRAARWLGNVCVCVCVWGGVAAYAGITSWFAAGVASGPKCTSLRYDPRGRPHRETSGLPLRPHEHGESPTGQSRWPLRPARGGKPVMHQSRRQEQARFESSLSLSSWVALGNLLSLSRAQFHCLREINNSHETGPTKPAL